MFKKILFLIVFFPTFAQAQALRTLSGTIKDSKSNETLIGAVVYVENLDKATETNAYGYYVIQLPEGVHSIKVALGTYKTFEQTIEIKGNTEKNILLTQDADDLDELVIDVNPKKLNIRKPEMSVNKLTAEEIKKMPVILGETDVLKTLLLLPGVSNSGEATTGFNVRGGGSDQNLLQLDEAVVYNSSHLYGFFSVFNTDALKDIKLYKGGIPSRFGGRASSVLDMHQRDGNSKSFQTSGGIGLLSSRLLAEGPIVQDKASFLVAGRASYAHLFLKLTDNKSSAYFYDLNLKLNYTLNDYNRLYLSGYFGRDVFKLKELFDNKYGNTMFNLRWNHVYSPQLFSNTSLIYSDYYYGLTLGFVGFNWDSGIVNYNLKQDFTQYVNDKLELKYGFQAIHYTFNPGEITPDKPESPVNFYKIPSQYAVEPALYIEAEQELTSRVTINYGLRYSMFYRLGEENINLYQNTPVGYDTDSDTYFEETPIGTRFYAKNKSIANFDHFEPRFALSVALDDESSIKMSYNRMAQYIHLISNTSAATPLDIWAPSGTYIKPQLVDQGAVGYFKNIANGAYTLEVESYVKLGQNRLDYIDGAELVGNRAIEQVLLSGKTESYGLELLMRKNTGRFTGWIAYTLSKSMQQTKGRTPSEVGINYGEWYRTPYDRKHDLAIVANYELSKKWDLSANFIVQSGRPVTYPIGQYDILGYPIPSYDYRNNHSLPAFHHLDVSAIYTPSSAKDKKWKSEWVFGIYNVYNRKNAASITFREKENYAGQNEAVKLSVFGIVPSVTYNFKF